MKITIEQLPLALKKNLTPFYLITGDELFLLQEAAQIIRDATQIQGFQGRKIFNVETGFNWEDFLTEATQQSLFSQQTLIELRIDATKINENAQKALLRFMELSPKDKILLILTEKLEAKQQNNKWYKQIEQQGTLISIWPLQGTKLQRWLQQRCQQTKLTIDATGLQILQELTEGNLAAAAQAIEKLSLNFGSSKISANNVTEVINDSSHFDIFNLVDSAMAGNAKRTLTILENLKNEGIEPSIILWAFTRELRNLILMQLAIQQGKSIDEVFFQFRVWENKKAITQAALIRHSLTQLYQLIQKAAEIDSTIKGAVNGNSWLQLSDFCFHFCRKSS